MPQGSGVKLPYERSTADSARALGEMQKVLRSFGCTKFGNMVDDERGEILVQFEYRGQKAQVRASFKGYAAAWLRHNPYSNRMKSTKFEHEQRALKIASVAVYSILRDWIKGQTTAIETGILSFEGAFLGQLLLPNGDTLLDHVQNKGLLKLSPPSD